MDSTDNLTARIERIQTSVKRINELLKELGNINSHPVEVEVAEIPQVSKKVQHEEPANLIEVNFKERRLAKQPVK